MTQTLWVNDEKIDNIHKWDDKDGTLASQISSFIKSNKKALNTPNDIAVKKIGEYYVSILPDAITPKRDTDGNLVFNLKFSPSRQADIPAEQFAETPNTNIIDCMKNFDSLYPEQETHTIRIRIRFDFEENIIKIIDMMGTQPDYHNSAPE